MPISTFPSPHFPFALKLCKYITFSVSKSKASEAEAITFQHSAFEHVGINEDHPNRNKQGVYLELAITRVSHRDFYLAENSRQAGK